MHRRPAAEEWTAPPAALLRQFAIDLDDLPPLETPGVGALPAELLPGLQALRNVAGGKMLDLSDSLSEYAEGCELKLKNLGLMPKTKFVSAMGIIFNGSAVTLERLMNGVILAYGAGDTDRYDGLPALVQWKRFAADFDDIPYIPPAWALGPGSDYR